MNLPNKKYKIIYADPPWEYGSYSNKVGKKAKDGNYSKYKITPYNAMSLEDIKKLPVNDLAEDNSVLLLWCTFPCLEMGLEVIKTWGFNYKTVGFVWVKRYKHSDGYFVGLGNYTRANAEICLLATKGKGLTRKSKMVRQICDLPVSDHSKKPHIIRDRIIKLFGNVSRIELFARMNIPGWDCWGNDEKLKLEPLEVYNE